jgi:hypothetical protein
LLAVVAGLARRGERIGDDADMRLVTRAAIVARDALREHGIDMHAVVT